MDDDPLRVAIREFREELGVGPPSDRQRVFLGKSRQPSGKRISAWALNGDLDIGVVRSNIFTVPRCLPPSRVADPVETP
jgi:predicted NUDIX family NTP pyrophosphohydrolase